MLKVNLIVVSGKPEGKVIPLTAPVFRIGRDESCHLRPNSVEVSRRHTEITISDTTVVVNDLGSRNGTLVNGQLLTAPHRLKSGELLKVGPLTFAVSIHETAGTGSSVSVPTVPPVRPTLEGAPQGQIESWLVADNARPTPDRPSGVYDGDTLTIDAYKGAGGQIPGVPPAPEAEVDKRVFDDDSLEFEQLEEGKGDGDEESTEAGVDTDGGDEEASDPNGFLDESNPFFIPKKATAVAAAEDSKKSYKDTSDAANDILRKMIDRRRASKP